MNHIVIYILGALLVACSSLSYSQKTNNTYDTLVTNTTKFLLKRDIITNRCVTQNDTIFIAVKNKGELIANYYYYDTVLSPFEKPYVCNEFRSRRSCLLLFLDNLTANNKLEFEYSCAGSAHGYLKLNKNNEIEDVQYVTRSH